MHVCVVCVNDTTFKCCTSHESFRHNKSKYLREICCAADLTPTGKHTCENEITSKMLRVMNALS